MRKDWCYSLSEAPMDPTEGMSAEEREEYWRDYELASKLLAGVWQTDKYGLTTIKILSPTTKPTEEEGRRALRRVLDRKHIPSIILAYIEDLFDPGRTLEARGKLYKFEPSLLQKVVFKKHNQGHANLYRDEDIHNLVFQALYDWPNGVGGRGFRNKKNATAGLRRRGR